MLSALSVWVLRPSARQGHEQNHRGTRSAKKRLTCLPYLIDALEVYENHEKESPAGIVDHSNYPKRQVQFVLFHHTGIAAPRSPTGVPMVGGTDLKGTRMLGLQRPRATSTTCEPLGITLEPPRARETLCRSAMRYRA